MASLLPLLHDLLPMIMPSEVRVTRNNELVPIAERAERPPWYQHRQKAQKQQQQQKQPSSSPLPPNGLDVDAGEPKSVSESDSGNFEPIQLFDHEEKPTTDPAFGDIPGSVVDPLNAGKNGVSASAQQVINGPIVLRKDAMVGVTDRMCATVLTVKPRSASVVHHHGEQDAILYASAGRGVLLISPSIDAVKALRADIKGEAPTHEEEQPRRIELSPGDFAFIPAWTEHQVVNESNDGDVVWVVTRNGGQPVQVDLETWGGERIGR